MNAKIFLIFLFLLLNTPDSFASKFVANYVYLQSGLEGFYYVRSIPEEDHGTKGLTAIYRVNRDEDQLVDSYNWYTRGKLFLGWSPIVGKVTLVRLDNENENEALIPPEYELSFYMGGTHLKSYNRKNLSEMGLFEEPYGRINDSDILGVQQVSNTNDYIFSIKKKNSELVRFDITTGVFYKGTENEKIK